MERVLDVYAKPYDRSNPVLCFDERPCQLLDDVLSPLLPTPGKTAKQDYHYKRNGTCVVLLAVEPLTGKRIVEVSPTKKKVDYARFMKKVANAYKNVAKIIVVQDNLNTHNPSSFYENMSPSDAFSLMQKFEMIYTPKKASWLNMAELEFAALSKQCLDRRIGKLEDLTKEVITWTKKRNRDSVKVNWQFSIENARQKFQRHYKTIKNN